MTDKEVREGDQLKNLIQAAYEFSDEELLADLEEVEATLSDSDFPGIEDRMYRKMMAQLAEEDAENASEAAAEETVELTEIPNHSETTAEELPSAETIVESQKVVRFGKKKAIVVGILAAAFVGMLGVTAIGEKNYFFRDGGAPVGVIVDNDRNLKYNGSLDEIYYKIESKLEIPVLKMGYIPKELEIIELNITDKNADIVLKYNGKYAHFFQERLIQEASVGVNSDRVVLDETIYNEWIDEYFLFEEEILEGGNTGYAAILRLDNARYRFLGQFEETTFKKIIENLIY